ncbi:unnamed protein product [Rotaria sp. Silwood2]|nr:unnamed protein product [Rotaria sp. Silwood2]CAF4345910.1 unnamed protein product [Rotaria sp. Silwood2]
MRSIKCSIYLHRFLYTLLFCSFVIISINFYRSTSDIKNDPSLEVNNNSLCFKWSSIDHQKLRANSCLPYSRIISSIWTHDGTGIMKYIQRIATRKLGNIRVSQLNDECELIQDNYFFSDSKNYRFVQIYIMPLTMNVNNNSTCSTDLVRIIKFEKEKINQIYFKRKSILATVAYQYLDKMRQDRNLTFDWKISFSTTIKKATIVTKHLISYFKSIPNKKSTIINSEDMIHSNFIDSKKQLIDFISLLGFNTSTQTFKDIVQYDCYHFVQDATWWDQSETIEYILSILLNLNLKTIDTSNREQLYQSYAPNNYFNINPIKRGFTIQSILDKVRNRYAHNDKCQIIVFICITNCYDDLPIIRETVPPGTCFVALLDTKTMSAFKQNSLTGVDPMNMQNQWDLIDLGSSDSLFRVAAKLTETVKMLGHRMFPMAKWFVWLDGKAFIININQILLLATTSIIGLHHHDYN